MELKKDLEENIDLEVEIESEKKEKYELKDYMNNSPIIFATPDGITYDGNYRQTLGNGSVIQVDSICEFPSQNRFSHNQPMLFSAYEIKYVHIFEDPYINLNEACPALKGFTYEDFLEAKKLIWNAKYIPVYDSDFHETLKEIRTQDLIGILAVGAHSNKARVTTFSSFLISTRNQIYMFDIQFTPKNFWTMGLKNLLEDSKIIKIVYDGKTVGDILYNRYRIRMANVYDVMVGDYELSKEESNLKSFRKYPELLEKYLKVPQGMFSYTELVLQGCTHTKRPLADKMKLHLSLHVAFLIYLYDVQNALLLKDFYTVSYTYSQLDSSEAFTKDLCPEMFTSWANGDKKSVSSSSSENNSPKQKDFSKMRQIYKRFSS